MHGAWDVEERIMNRLRTFKSAISHKTLLNIAYVMTTASLTISCGQASTRENQEETKGVSLGELSVGEKSISYANLDTPETLPIGPAGIFSVKDGYAVPDNARGRLVLLNHAFKLKRMIDVHENAQGVTSVVQDGEDLVALDGFSAKPKLLRIKTSGGIEGVDIDIDSATPPTGLKQDDSGTILDYENGSRLYHVVGDGASLGFVTTNGYTWGGVSYSVDESVDSTHRERSVHVGGSVATVRVPNYLGAVQIVGPDGNGGVYVRAEDVQMSGKIAVERSLWHLDSSAHILSVSLVPLEEQSIRVNDDIALSQTGEPVAMVTKREAVQFWRLNQFSPSLILSRSPAITSSGNPDGLAVAKQGLITYSGTCLTSSQMVSNAQEYLNVSQSMTSNNINNNGTCTARTKASYLTNPGTYSSVSYDWGGWDTPTAFKSAMTASGKAGNLNTAAILACSYGVDCSGFVTRVWGFTDWKRNTIDIPGTATSKAQVYGPAYYVGDALNYPGVHVVLFSSLTTNGLYIYESCGEPYGRVVYRAVTWSYVSQYTGWRSRTSCN